MIVSATWIAKPMMNANGRQMRSLSALYFWRFGGEKTSRLAFRSLSG